MPSRKIEDCEYVLQQAWKQLKDSFETLWPSWTLSLTCTYRSPEEQLELYKRGRKLENGQWVDADTSKQVTWTLHSKHTAYPSKAFDFVIIGPDGKAIWDFKADVWQSAIGMAKSIPGVTSGATWTKTPDNPHIQLNEEISK